MRNTLVFSELGRPLVSRGWQVEAAVRGIAGTLIVISVLLAVAVDSRWLYLTAFVGLNLLQSAFSGWCLMSNLVTFAVPRLRKATQ